MYENTKLKNAVIASVLGHLLVLLFINTFLKIRRDFSFGEKPKEIIKVQKVSQEFVDRLRRVGVKDGVKDSNFSMPLKTRDGEKVKINNFGKDLALKNLRPSPESNVAPQQTKTQKQASASPRPGAFIVKKAPETRQEAVTTMILEKQAQKMTHQDLRELGALPSNVDALKNTEFNISVAPPEGISEDKLNSTEKIYYSFQKRTFESYVRSFISTYRDFMRTMPYIQPRLRREKHIMTGRVTFDTEGNIISIKMLKWSDDDNIQKMFEETLKSIRSMPNPPKGLIRDDKEFIIYYQLNINAD